MADVYCVMCGKPAEGVVCKMCSATLPPPCPFCGSRITLEEFPGRFNLWRSRCESRLCPCVVLITAPTRDLAIAAWNTRNGVPPASVPQDATEVRE